MARNTTKGVGQLIIVCSIIMCIIGVLFTYFINAKKSAVDAKKKAELSQLYTLLQFYYVGENEAPINPSGDGWCAINAFYGPKKCLQEVVRDGYVEAIPQSPNEELYLYHDDEDKFLIATRLHQKLDKESSCKYIDDSHMWCKVFYKN